MQFYLPISGYCNHANSGTERLGVIWKRRGMWKSYGWRGLKGFLKWPETNYSPVLHFNLIWIWYVWTYQTCSRFLREVSFLVRITIPRLSYYWGVAEPWFLSVKPSDSKSDQVALSIFSQIKPSLMWWSIDPNQSSHRLPVYAGVYFASAAKRWPNFNRLVACDFHTLSSSKRLQVPLITKSFASHVTICVWSTDRGINSNF